MGDSFYFDLGSLAAAFESLGPAAQQAGDALADFSYTLSRDFRILTLAGVDPNAIVAISGGLRGGPAVIQIVEEQEEPTWVPPTPGARGIRLVRNG